MSSGNIVVRIVRVLCYLLIIYYSVIIDKSYMCSLPHFVVLHDHSQWTLIVGVTKTLQQDRW